jgi:hypothetical protein
LREPKVSLLTERKPANRDSSSFVRKIVLAGPLVTPGFATDLTTVTGNQVPVDMTKENTCPEKR